MGRKGNLIGKKETAVGLPKGTVPAPAGAQRLIQPLNNMYVGFAYKNSDYPKVFHGFTHYGADYWGDRTVYASGDGKVLKTGYDSTFGNTVIVRYDKAFVHGAGKVMDLVARYYHLSSIRCRAGQSTTKDTILGVTGTTGKYSTGIHLHFELSTAVEDPYGVPGIYNTNMLHWAKDSTIDPAWVLHTKPSLPDRQSLKSAGTGYQRGGKSEDWSFPTV